MNPHEPLTGRKGRIFVVEDHPLVRTAVTCLVNQQPDLMSCGEAHNLEETAPGVRTCKPDLVLLDLHLPDGCALQIIGPLRSEFPALRILVLSQCDEALHAEAALCAGAHGYVMKECASQEVLGAIRTVLAGQIYVSRKLANRLAHRLPGIKLPATAPGVEHLSDREREVLRLLGSGLGTRQIARELKLSEKTIETYREHLKDKLGLPDADQLIRYAAQFVEGKPALPAATSGPPPIRHANPC